MMVPSIVIRAMPISSCIAGFMISWVIFSTDVHTTSHCSMRTGLYSCFPGLAGKTEKERLLTTLRIYKRQQEMSTKARRVDQFWFKVLQATLIIKTPKTALGGKHNDSCTHECARTRMRMHSEGGKGARVRGGREGARVRGRRGRRMRGLSLGLSLIDKDAKNKARLSLGHRRQPLSRLARCRLECRPDVGFCTAVRTHQSYVTSPS